MVGTWKQVEVALLKLDQEKSGQKMVSIQVLLGNDHLPPAWKSESLKAHQLFQTNLVGLIDCQCIVAAMRVMPYVLYQNGGLPTQGVTREALPLTAVFLDTWILNSMPK